MKNLRSALTVIALITILSTSAMAGNIGLRTDETEANAVGNIGLRSETETSLLGQLEIFIKGNIGLLVSTTI
ncbi:MAG TPA: hypothetical protein VN844_12805 [Pyrinomonadaceae bacterium]|nr:hypothetical protein [Pyrinomonadaceae bacterium]